MSKLCLLSAVLAAQVFCFAAENCFANTDSSSEQSESGKEILKLTENGN
ncbi:MAG: hypothetical protein ABFQ95_04125 [Pseudomonadota bacterium]